MGSPQLENGYTKIANEILDALCKIRIPGESRRVLDTIIRKTYGYHKKEDWISLSQFCLSTGMTKPHICRAIKILLEMNLIAKNSNAIAKNGNEVGATYCFNKDYKKWKPLPKLATLPGLAINVARIGNLPLPDPAPTKDILTKDNITKDIYIGDPVKFWLDKFDAAWNVMIENKAFQPWIDSGINIEIAGNAMEGWLTGKLRSKSKTQQAKARKDCFDRFIIGWLNRILEKKNIAPIRRK